MRETALQPSEAGAPPAPDPGPSLDARVDLYLIRGRQFHARPFMPSDLRDSCTASEGASLRRFIRRMVVHRNAVVRWVGRVTRAGFRYYQKLEDRIDPLERTVKALASRRPFRVWHGSEPDPPTRFREFLRGQVVKHGVWLVIDGLVALVFIALTPVLVPIPGPNIFLYYPLLRAVSHYRALTGARRALNHGDVDFVYASELTLLEESLRSGADVEAAIRSSGFDRDGLTPFLERAG